MNQTSFIRKIGGLRLIFALMAAIFPLAKANAQSADQNGGSRWLFIFDTSADMKKRVPATQLEVNGLLAASMGGQMHSGDSMGLWTFDKTVHTGEFPLLHWMPEDADAIASGMNKFIHDRHYSKTTSFKALKPLLDEVIQDSPKLTVLIFCDGEDPISGTPYDSGVNEVFRQRLAEQKQTRQPFVLVLRTQFGQYVGCTIDFPPGMVNFPPFHPISLPPQSVQPAATPTPPPPTSQPKTGPPLIIIGTNVETHWPAQNAAAIQTSAVLAPPIQVTSPTNRPATIKKNIITAPLNNPVAPPQIKQPPVVTATNVQTIPPPQPSAAMQTNLASVPPVVTVPPAKETAPPQTSGPNHRNMLAIGAGLLIASMALVAFAIIRARKTESSSLISHSMRKR